MEKYHGAKASDPDLRFKDFLSNLSGLNKDALDQISTIKLQITSDSEFMSQLGTLFKGDEGAVRKHAGMLAMLTYFVSKDPAVSTAFSNKELFKEVWNKAFAAFNLYASARFSEISSLHDDAIRKIQPTYLLGQATQFAALINNEDELRKRYDKAVSKGAYARIEGVIERLYTVSSFAKQLFAEEKTTQQDAFMAQTTARQYYEQRTKEIKEEEDNHFKYDYGPKGKSA
jgi:hypothetical protein